MKFEYKEAVWKDSKLFLRGEDTGISVSPDQVLPTMFRIGWDTGEMSADFYNFIRARDNAVKYGVRKANEMQENRLLESRGDV